LLVRENGPTFSGRADTGQLSKYGDRNAARFAPACD
jgi:hypothetical protein